VINGIICAREVPASFETLLICRTDNSSNGPLWFEWSSDNGTIKGNGESITWLAPSVPGTYKIAFKITDTKGRENTGSVDVKVVPFSRTIIDVSPEISLTIPIWCTDLITEQQAVNPLTTAEVEYNAPLAALNKYKYTWSCNGGKMQGTGIKDGSTSKIGWIPPGVPGFYTVTVKISDNVGNLYGGSVYFNVINPACCGGNGTCGVR